MKAFLLAAGLGSRLRPLTSHTPKCLIPIQGTPLLEIWFSLLRRSGVESVLINTHYLAEKVEEFTRKRDYGLEITTVREPVLKGSAGTVRDNSRFVEGEENFWIVYADNLTDLDLIKMRDFHSSHRGCLTVSLFPSPDPKACGIAEIDGCQKITDFQEKPGRPVSNLANAGIYLARQRVFDIIPSRGAADFGYHVFPKLIGDMYGYPVPKETYLKDIGTLEAYEAAQKTWAGSIPEKVN